MFSLDNEIIHKTSLILDAIFFASKFVVYCNIKFYKLFIEAEKQASVAKIQWEQKVSEKDSEKRMSEIEGQSNIPLYIPVILTAHID